MIIGTATVTFGNLLRQWCFHQLGSLFTFEITIQSGHSLVTSGPYNCVRHPSYTGVFMTLLGSTLVGFAPGSYLRERWLAGWLNMALGHEEAESAGYGMILLSALGQIAIFALVALWFVTGTYALRSTVKRVEVEDRELHKIFGKEWEVWAARVRWRLIPGIY